MLHAYAPLCIRRDPREGVRGTLDSSSKARHRLRVEEGREFGVLHALGEEVHVPFLVVRGDDGRCHVQGFVVAVLDRERDEDPLKVTFDDFFVHARHLCIAT